MTIDRDALVEKAAKAIFDVRDDEFDLDEWGDIDSDERERYMCDARAVLDAILPEVQAQTLEDAADAVRASDWWHEGTNINFSDRVREFLRARAAALGDAPQMSSEQTNERDELILTVRDVDADYHGTGPLALSGAEAALIADAVLAAGYHRDAPTGGTH